MKQTLLTMLTGSLPLELEDDDLMISIRKGVKLQLDNKVDILVDGQFGHDIVTKFASSLGLVGTKLPYRVRNPLKKLERSITLYELEQLAEAAEGRPLKAHITGPTTMLENCLIDDETPNIYKGGEGRNQLMSDLARALADEATFIAKKAEELNIEYLQIDEPTLTFGADLDLAKEALTIITKAWRATCKRDVILHVCADIGGILEKLLEMPVDILNLENIYLRDVDESKLDALRKSDKKLVLGVVPVNTDWVPTPRRVRRELLDAFDRYGEEHIVGISPVCGLRLSSAKLAKRRIESLSEASTIWQSQEMPHLFPGGNKDD